jgi:hypothetical protein
VGGAVIYRTATLSMDSASAGAVGLDGAVADADHSVGELGDIGFMRDEDDGVSFGVQIVK